ncbi:hypothetical protein A2U01_0001469, partial [Trifolium medium]|nr:hypothetical protein [Trifolium medium]
MMSISMSDVAAIVGLNPYGDTFHPDQQSANILEVNLLDVYKSEFASFGQNSSIPNLGGPLWLLQLWLNAIYYPDFKTVIVPTNSVFHNSLAVLSEVPLVSDYDSSFRKYFEWFLTLDSHHPNFSLLSQNLLDFSHLGHKSLFAVKDNNDLSNLTFWRNILTNQYIVNWVSGSSIRVFPYQPRLYARQFGLSQMLHTPLSTIYNVYPLSKDKDKRKSLTWGQFESDEQRRVNVTRFEFHDLSPSFFMTEDFNNWWQNHFSKIAKSLDACFTPLQTGTAELKTTDALPLAPPSSSKRKSTASTAVPTSSDVVAKRTRRSSRGTAKPATAQNLEIEVTKRETRTKASHDRAKASSGVVSPSNTSNLKETGQPSKIATPKSTKLPTINDQTSRDERQGDSPARLQPRETKINKNNEER